MNYGIFGQFLRKQISVNEFISTNLLKIIINVKCTLKIISKTCTCLQIAAVIIQYTVFKLLTPLLKG